MPNIGTLLKEEISRLARKEVRSVVDTTRKATTQHRRQIATLKRQVAKLERQVVVLARRMLDTQVLVRPDAPSKRTRFVPKGLRSHRNRLGLSAGDYGKLAGVSAQSIYNWERELAHPREEQLATLATLRGMGKKEAAARLTQLDASKAGRR